MKKIICLITFLSFLLSSCQTYRFAQQVKMVSFDDNLSPGQSVGNIRGESCQSMILGFATGAEPTLDLALEKAQKALKNQRLRYITDLSTSNSDFDAFFYKKFCIIVKGIGYK